MKHIKTFKAFESVRSFMQTESKNKGLYSTKDVTEHIWSLLDHDDWDNDWDFKDYHKTIKRFGKKWELIAIDPNELKFNEDFDEDMVEEYEDRIENGIELEPIVVDSKNEIIDGNHRAKASLNKGVSIQAYKPVSKKLYESLDSNIEDTLEDIKWIMIEMTESHKLFGHEKDDCFLYEVSNMPSEEDLESAKGRLEDLGYNIVYIGKIIDSHELHGKTICWIVKSELCEEYSPLPIIVNGKSLEFEGNKIIEDIQKNILLKMWKEEPTIDNNRIQNLCVFNYFHMKKVSELFREYLGPKAKQIIDSILGKKEHHISKGGYEFDIAIESYSIHESNDDIDIRCKILPGGTVDIIMDDGRTLNLEDAVNDGEIGWEIKGEINECIEEYFYNNLQITSKTGYGIYVIHSF